MGYLSCPSTLFAVLAAGCLAALAPAASVEEPPQLFTVTQALRRNGDDRASFRDDRKDQGYEVVQDESEEGGGTPASLMCLMAAVGGSLSATGANIMAWSSHHSKQTGRRWSRLETFGFGITCAFLNLSGIAMFALSTILGGAVAVVMPVQTGANLMMNMLWQICLGMKTYDKSMRMGTLILAFCVAELGELGPAEPAKPDIHELMGRQLAQIWVAVLLIGAALTLAASVVSCRAHYQDSAFRLASMTLSVSFTTVIGSSTSKCFALLTGWEQIASIVFYFFDGLMMMVFTVLANAMCDVSLFVPAQLSSQIVLNMLTGYAIWEDAKYIDKPLSYILCYVICVMAVYLISADMDILQQASQRYWLRRTKLSAGRPASQFGRQVLKLVRFWQGERDGVPLLPQHVNSNPSGQSEAALTSITTWERAADREDSYDAVLEATLVKGVEVGAITTRELIDLALLLLKERGCAPCAELVHWIEEDVRYFKDYLTTDPAFGEELRRLVPPQELGRLAALKPIDRTRSTTVGTVSSNGRSTELGLPAAP